MYKSSIWSNLFCFGMAKWAPKLSMLTEKSKNFDKKVTQIRASQIRASQIRASQIRPSQIRAVNQIRASQIRASQIRATEISSNHHELYGAIFWVITAKIRNCKMSHWQHTINYLTLCESFPLGRCRVAPPSHEEWVADLWSHRVPKHVPTCAMTNCKWLTLSLGPKAIQQLTLDLQKPTVCALSGEPVPWVCLQ